MKKITITFGDKEDDMTFAAEGCTNADCIAAFGRVLGNIAINSSDRNKHSSEDIKRFQACLLWELADNAGFDIVTLTREVFPKLFAEAEVGNEATSAAKLVEEQG